MRLLFLDESGKLDQGGLFALGGVAVRDRDRPAPREPPPSGASARAAAT